MNKFEIRLFTQVFQPNDRAS